MGERIRVANTALVSFGCELRARILVALVLAGDGGSSDMTNTSHTPCSVCVFIFLRCENARDCIISLTRPMKPGSCSNDRGRANSRTFCTIRGSGRSPWAETTKPKKCASRRKNSHLSSDRTARPHPGSWRLSDSAIRSTTKIATMVLSESANCSCPSGSRLDGIDSGIARQDFEHLALAKELLCCATVHVELSTRQSQ